ncbi:PrsW family intramembrane metalloprotease [Candidatus Micrarchaeota archaeon]|nr:PrsW family intramembrane metalloprotease [Candidatus Micrarchaeota archaeon]MBU1165375.1 PrsW family intramembrane metalloprotease [Candidatus Micrarchaeota archaeon]MBU1886226.1 PrsW family intramembrane metalloprotease [Candidatus Micrarchaeota archaeon]
MLKFLNRLFVVLLLVSAFTGILISISFLFLQAPFLELFNFSGVEDMESSPDFLLLGDVTDASSSDSPFHVEYTIKTPPLQRYDFVYLEVYSDEKHLIDIDCMQDFVDYTEYIGLTEIKCSASIPYDYSSSQNYQVYATIYGDDYQYSSEPSSINVDWKKYEDYFFGVSYVMVFVVVGLYLLVLLPLTIIVAYISYNMKCNKSYSEKYTILSLLNPLANSKTLFQKFNAFLISPYFWLFEIAGIFIILIYMALSAQIWKPTALIAFILSGLMAFIIPYLWCAFWWYADFREREPLRIIITFFLWGMLSALMAIGINSLGGLIFEILGIGFLGAFLIAPVVEEMYKGTGLALLSEHREYNSIEDGFVFGFVIGMGFSFIEDWVYMLSSPMGSDVVSWFILFIARSIFFSANHGIYTAIVGGTIGFLIERGFKAPAIGLLIGVPIAAFFHAMHNSGEVMQVLFGAGGLLAYCCLLIPLFDYGGFVLLIIIFLWALFRKKAARCKPVND